MRVLIIEQDQHLNQSLSFFLRNKGMVVDSAYQGEEGCALAKLYDYDIIVMELLLPDIGGYEALKKLRTGGIKSPILILSTICEVDKKIACFSQGADDYVVKPCDKNELFSRIQAIVRRSRGYAGSTIRIGKMEINLETKRIMISGQLLHLTDKEYTLVELLCLRQGMTVSKEQFLNHLYGGMDEPEMKIIDVFLCNIRKKIKKLTGGVQYIHTVWGRGYILREKPLDTN